MKHILTILAILLLAAMPAVAKDDVKLPDSYNYKRGLEAYQSNNYGEAYSYLTDEVKENPKNGFAYLILALIDTGIEDWGDALSNCDKAVKYLPKKAKEYRAMAYQTRGDIYVGLAMPERALKEYAEALDIDPTNTDVLNARGNLNAITLGDYAAAEADYRRIIELEPANRTGYLGVARGMVALQQYAEAIPLLDRAVALDPGYGYGYALRAECYINLEEWGPATDDLISALDADGDNEAFTLMQDLTQLSDQNFFLLLSAKPYGMDQDQG